MSVNRGLSLFPSGAFHSIFSRHVTAPLVPASFALTNRNVVVVPAVLRSKMVDDITVCIARFKTRSKWPQFTGAATEA